MKRFTLTSLMVLIAVLALGLAAMRDGSALTEAAVFTLVVVSLFVGLVGAYVRRKDGAWAGFVICGWGYAILAFVPSLDAQIGPHLLITIPLEGLVARLQPPPPALPRAPKLNLPPSIPVATSDPEMIAQFISQNPTLHSRLTPSDQIAMNTYTGQYQIYQAQTYLRDQWEVNSRRIGQSLLVLIFGLLGAMLGRFLANRRHPAPPTSSVSSALDANQS